MVSPVARTSSRVSLLDLRMVQTALGEPPVHTACVAWQAFTFHLGDLVMIVRLTILRTFLAPFSRLVPPPS